MNPITHKVETLFGEEMKPPSLIPDIDMNVYALVLDREGVDYAMICKFDLKKKRWVNYRGENVQIKGWIYPRDDWASKK